MLKEQSESSTDQKVRIKKESLRVPSGAGHELGLHCWEPTQSGRKASILLFPAMGAPARAYVKAALFLAQRGWNVFAADLRGAGESRPLVAPGVDFHYGNLLFEDWPAVVAAVRARRPDDALVLFGHSLGGQISAPYAGLAPDQVAALVLLTTCSPHYRGFPAPRRYFLYAYYTFAAIVARLLGYFPGHKLGFGGINARGLMLDWTRLGRRGRFPVVARPDAAQIDVESLFERVRCPTFALSFDGDSYTSRAAIQAIHQRLTNTHVEWRHVPAAPGEEPGPGAHFGWLKNPALLEPIESWLKEKLAE